MAFARSFLAGAIFALSGAAFPLPASTVSVGARTFKTYPFEDPDPVPATDQRRYPYFRYDRTFNEGAPAPWQTVTLENEKIRVILLPQVGGKVWTATDKKTGRDFLFTNHVMKFRDIALRGPWTAGGIEYNFGIIGHAPTSGTPVDWYACENPDGSSSCFIASYELITRTWWQVEVRLPKDAAEFETHVTWYNASGLPAPYYHWMNAAYSVSHDPEFLFPGKDVIGHQGEIETRAWPIMEKNGRRVDDMPGNAWGGPKSYHVLPGNNGFYGIWWRELGFGSYHRSEPYEKFGRKIWLQTMSPYGLLWVKFKTDDDGQNAELQSGRCFNQPRYNTYKTPFKHPVFAPGSTETFVEHWGPIHDRREFADDMRANRPTPKARPITAPDDFDWSSAWGEYVRGTQALAEHHEALGRQHLEAAIAKDRFLAPAYAALAGAEFRRGDYARVHALCEKALAINAYDALANYLDGFAYFVAGDVVTARERLGVAAQQPQYRAPALALIARGYLREGKRTEAAVAARKALQTNDLNLDALLALAIAARGEPADARKAVCEDALRRLPLAHAFRYELACAGGCDDWSRYVRNELPAETFLELGSWYEETGLLEDARTLFARAGTNVIAAIRLGDWQAAKAQPVAGVFPFRRETLPSLERAVREDGHWKFRYLLAAELAFFGYGERATALLESCGDEPDEAVFYQYRATHRTGEAKLADLARAQALGDSWRIGRQYLDYYEAKEDWPKVLEIAGAYVAKFPGRDSIALSHARALQRLGRNRECMAYLSTLRLLPSEYGGFGTDIWHAAQDALGLKRTWPENLGKGEPYPDVQAPDRLSPFGSAAGGLATAGERPYEFVRANRTNDTHVAFEDFEKPSPWHVETRAAAATFARAQDHQLFGAWTGKLVYRATGTNGNAEVVLRRATPVPVPADADTMGLWVRGTRFGKGSNVDPATPPPDLHAIFRTPSGERRVWLDRIDWAAWHYVQVRFKPEDRAALAGAAFEGLALTGRFQPDDRMLHFDSLALFKEKLGPLALKPRPKRPLAPLAFADQGLNTGAGTLPFPTREETILPDVAEPAPGETLARFTGEAVAGTNKAALKVTTTRVGRTLIVDFAAPAGAVTELTAGLPEEAAWVRTVDVPFLAYGAGESRVGVEELTNGLFRLALFDWYRSNASTIRVKRTPRGRLLSVVYRPKTDGTYNPLSERLFITLSPDFTGVFPNIPNPVSPWKRETGRRVWRSHAAYDRADDAALWRLIHKFGMREVTITDHETMWRSTGESYTLRTYADPMKGGDEAQNAYTRLLIDELGYAYGPYNNYVGIAPANAYWSPDYVNRSRDGSLAKSWMRVYAMKPAFAAQLCEEIVPQVQKKFNFNTVYCDVFTTWVPGMRTDYDARVPGASTLSATYYAFGETLLLQKKLFNGPVWSEGGHQMFLAGVADGSYGQDWGYRCGVRPWIVDFDLLKLHPLDTDFGMGMLGMFSPGVTAVEKMRYLPHTPTVADRDRLIDKFLGATLAFGHAGFLLIDYLFDPPKPFGLAYCGPGVRKTTDEGLAIAMRSYFMVQAIAARYTVSTAAKIRYVAPDGKLLDTSAAVRTRAYERNQVCVLYRDGTRVVVNGGPHRLTTTFEGRKYELPPYGYRAETADGAIVVDASDAGGTRADYCSSPDYIYIDGRGTRAERPLAKAAGTAVARREGDGWEIISLGSKPCSFRLDGRWRDFTFKPGETHRKIERRKENFGCARVVPGATGKAVGLPVRGVDFASSPRFALDGYAAALPFGTKKEIYFALTDGKGVKNRYQICDFAPGHWNEIVLDRERDVIKSFGKIDWSDIRTASLWVPACTNADAAFYFGNLRAAPDPLAFLPPKPGERRFAWCLAKALGDAGDWEATAAFLAKWKFTDVIIQAGRVGGVHYESAIVPRAKGTPKGDVLRAAIAACRPRGIRVHAMISTLRCTKDETPKAWLDQLVSRDMVQRDPKGGIVNYQHHKDNWLCPSSAETRALVVSLVKELVETVGVDGVQLDYIRFASPQFCYCPRCRAAFASRAGKAFATAEAIRNEPSVAAQWNAFRAENVTATLRAVRTYMRAARSAAELSATFFRDAEERFATLGQDYAAWAREGLVDNLFPMDYTGSSTQFRSDVLRQAEAIAGTTVGLYPGIVVCSPHFAAHPERYVEQVNFTRAQNLAGFAAYVLDARGARFYEILDHTLSARAVP